MERGEPESKQLHGMFAQRVCVYTESVADLAFHPCKCDVINGVAADVRRRGKGLQQREKKMENEPKPVPRR